MTAELSRILCKPNVRLERKPYVKKKKLKKALAKG